VELQPKMQLKLTRKIAHTKRIRMKLIGSEIYTSWIHTKSTYDSPHSRTNVQR